MSITQPQRINFFGNPRTITVDQFQSLPHIDQETIKVFKSYMINPNLSSKFISLKNEVKNLQDVEKALAQEPERSIKHKIISLCLLVASIGLIASAIILGCLIQPQLALIGLASMIPSIAALSIVGLTDPTDGTGDAFGIVLFPICWHQLRYAFSAFTHVRDLTKRKRSIEQSLPGSLQQVQQIVSQKSAIEKGIVTELNNMDIKDLNCSLNFTRINQLRVALRELNRAEEFFKN